MNKLIFHDDAQTEYVESYVWYHQRGSHIAEAFEREVENVLEALQEAPDRWPLYVGTWHRVLLRRFPFGIVFRVVAQQIVVIAIMHTRRKPGYWKNRLFDILPDN